MLAILIHENAILITKAYTQKLNGFVKKMIIIIQKHAYELKGPKKQAYILVKVLFSLGYP